MILENDNEALKQQVRDYWNAHPCGTQFTDLELGSKEFFEEVERFRYQTQPFMHELVEFNEFNGKKLLEVGCGLGTDLLQFARGGAHVTGVDLTPRSIDLVRKRFALYELPVDARVADAESLPFEDGTFDAVYSFGVLHHTPNTQKGIDELYRVLKPGGRAIVMMYHKNSLHVWMGLLVYGMRRSNARRNGSVLKDWVRVYDGEGNPLGKAYTKEEVRKMFGKFNQLQFTLCDPARRKLPRVANELNQLFLAKHLGFWLVIKGMK